MPSASVPEIFAKYPAATKYYEELLAFVKTLGKSTIEQKKTCAHVVAGSSAFLGIHPRKTGLRITVVLSQPISSKRIVKCDKASANRYHIDLDINTDHQLDDEVKKWIAEAYARSSS